MKSPTATEIEATMRQEFPGLIALPCEKTFLAAVAHARSHGVGYGWMRQAIGFAWKAEDPVGYIDDARLIELSRVREQAGCG